MECFPLCSSYKQYNTFIAQIVTNFVDCFSVLRDISLAVLMLVALFARHHVLPTFRVLEDVIAPSVYGSVLRMQVNWLRNSKVVRANLVRNILSKYFTMTSR
jgi:hypothetical protein